MKRIMLEAFTDESMGTLGLGLLDMPRHEMTNAATDGALIAHDLIEHVNGAEAIGSIDDELEALGAIWYVRGSHGQLFRNAVFRSAYTVHENIGSDISRMFRDHMEGSQHVSYEPLRARKTIADDDLREILGYAVKTWRSEFQFDNAEQEAEIVEDWKPYAEQSFKRMQIGYAKARRKWERHGDYAANNVFFAIADALDPVIKGIKYAGQRFALRYDMRGNASADEIYTEDF